MVDKIKRDARQRMAETGETYTEARRAVADKPSVPTAAQLRSAVTTLMRAWAPELVEARRDFDPDERYELECLGTDFCDCSSCQHYRYTQSRKCHLKVPAAFEPHAWCGKETTYRITPFCVKRDAISRTADEGDPDTVNGTVQLGDFTQRHPAIYACSTQHARALIAADQEYRDRFAADSPLATANTFYEVEQYKYTPDDYDVPGPLHPLLRELQSAARWTEITIGSEWKWPYSKAVDRDYDTRGMLRYVASAADLALRHLDYQAQVRREYGD